MKIGVPKELVEGEKRIPLIPAHAEKIIKNGAEIVIEKGLGAAIGIDDSQYTDAGAKISDNRDDILSSSDIVIRLRKPPQNEIGKLKSKTFHISLLDPFNEKELIKSLAQQKVTTVSLEMIPRTTLAQKMDVLSSQANLAGYVAVVIAAERLDKILPMMMTPAGTISPSRVFIIGAGVAGLQAIATARRLGARVEAFDTRPVVEEQVKSLGAKFIKIDLGETGQTEQGYAKALTKEQIQKQREGMAKVCEQSDIVITTAQLFGRKAPVIVTKDMVARMKPGSVLVDLAVENGGNIEGSEVNKEVETGGVRIIGLANLPGRAAVHASQMFSSNIYNLINHFWNSETKKFEMNLNDEIAQGCILTQSGEIVHKILKKHYSE